jgi:hypothetical protein
MTTSAIPATADSNEGNGSMMNLLLSVLTAVAEHVESSTRCPSSSREAASTVPITAVP